LYANPVSRVHGCTRAQGGHRAVLCPKFLVLFCCSFIAHAYIRLPHSFMSVCTNVIVPRCRSWRILQCNKLSCFMIVLLFGLILCCCSSASVCIIYSAALNETIFVCNQPPRPTQPGHLSAGRQNEYWR